MNDANPSDSPNPAASQLRTSEKTTKPCFCCEVKHLTFYKCFSIFCMIYISISIFNNLILLLAGVSTGLLTLIINIVLLSFLCIGFNEYNKSGNYGSDMSYYFALTNDIFAWISLIMFIVIIVLVGVLGTTIFAYFGLTVQGVAFGVVLGMAILMVLPFLLMWLYWSKCYLDVVKDKRAENSEETERQDKISEEMKSIDQANLTKNLTESEHAAAE